MTTKLTPARQAGRDDMDIAIRMRKLRYARGLTQTEMAAALGISFQQYQKYEQGRNRISAVRLAVIARILGVTPNDILCDPNGPCLSPAASEGGAGNEAGGGNSAPAGPSHVLADQKFADLLQGIQNVRTRQAVMILMEMAARDSAPRG